MKQMGFTGGGDMQLGVVMMGYGACAAACAGVMRVLEGRGLEPFAVCGVHAGAWPAALYLAGRNAEQMHCAVLQAAHMGRRMLHPGNPRAILRGKSESIYSGKKLEHLLLAQAGGQALGLCARRGLFVCRMAHTGRRLLFSSRDFAWDRGVPVCMQASVSFAARAAMSLPPFLPPQRWMGMELVADADAAAASNALQAMGAQRVLVIEPVLSPRRRMDALDLACAAADPSHLLQTPPHTALLRIVLDERYGAMSVENAAEIADGGYESAQRSMDSVLAALGMAQCRVLPFRGSVI